MVRRAESLSGSSAANGTTRAADPRVTALRQGFEWGRLRKHALAVHGVGFGVAFPLKEANVITF